MGTLHTITQKATPTHLQHELLESSWPQLCAVQRHCCQGGESSTQDRPQGVCCQEGHVIHQVPEVGGGQGTGQEGLRRGEKEISEAHVVKQIGSNRHNSALQESNNIY